MSAEKKTMVNNQPDSNSGIPGATETRLQHLESEVRRLIQRLDETASQTSTHARDLAAVGQKIDAMREDLKEIKLIPANYVPRVEMETRFRFNEERIEELQEALKLITAKLHETHVSVNHDLHQNTLVTYGAFITGLLTVLGLIFSLLQSWPHK